MDMVGHETESVNPVAVPAGSLLEQEIEAISVIILEEDRLTAVTPENHVIESAGMMNAWFTGHGEMISPCHILLTWEPDPFVLDPFVLTPLSPLFYPPLYFD